MNVASTLDRQSTCRPSALGRVLITCVKWYRDAVSPALPPRCRFYPTCSSYAVTALQRYGPARGGWLALRRILRCAPWHPGGVDHVASLGHSVGECEPPDHPERVAVRGNDTFADIFAPRNDVGPHRRSVSQETAGV